jgi:hypothetical protein
VHVLDDLRRQPRGGEDLAPFGVRDRNTVDDGRDNRVRDGDQGASHATHSANQSIAGGIQSSPAITFRNRPHVIRVLESAAHASRADPKTEIPWSSR